MVDISRATEPGGRSAFESLSMPRIQVQSPNVRYSPQHIHAELEYDWAECRREEDSIVVIPKRQRLEVRTERRPAKTGVMLVGWGGNNGTTLTAALLADRMGLRWQTKDGEKCAGWLGSLIQTSTVRLGADADGGDVWAPLCDLVPMVKPSELEVDGWDISSLDLEAATRRNRVLDVEVQRLLGPHLRPMRPRPAAFDLEFVAANQSERADNVLQGTKAERLQRLREDIRAFKKERGLDTVIVLWTANTERFCDVQPGIHDTADNLLAAIEANVAEVSSSTLYAVAAILEKCTYINGSPQNTLVPGCIELAERHGTFLAGDDLKTGQTKLKSVLTDFLVSAGMKPTAIVSYNHLGNNDGLNLSASHTFRSKEISKRNVVDDIVESNPVLFQPGETPDHVVVIKYVPSVGDSKRAMDEYTSEILFGGRHTLVIHNTCEDSLLAAPILLDLVLLAEFSSRVAFRSKDSEQEAEYVPFHSVLSLLSYLVKAPLVPRDAPVVNSLFKQRSCIENVLKACIGLRPEHHMQLEHKLAINILRSQ